MKGGAVSFPQPIKRQYIAPVNPSLVQRNKNMILIKRIPAKSDSRFVSPAIYLASQLPAYKYISTHNKVNFIDTRAKQDEMSARFAFGLFALLNSTIYDRYISIVSKSKHSPFQLKIEIITYVYPSVLLMLVGVVIRARNIPKGGQSEEEFVFTDNEMVWTSAGKTYTYAIKSISMYYDAKDYIIVIPNGKTPMMPAIKKDSFTVGTSDEFIAFLKSKGVKIQK